MGKLGGHPPVVGPPAGKIKEWMRSLVIQAAKMLLEGDEDGREAALMRAAVARFVAKYALELEKQWVEEAQQLGASNAQVAFALGLREQTTSRKYPNRRRPVTWEAKRE